MEKHHSVHSMRLRYHRLILFALTVIACLLAPPLITSVGAAPVFADPTFQALWQTGEAISANFWGPRLDGTSIRREAYSEAAGGTRLVQYFDKGRMELNRPSSLFASSGLLTVELLRGQIQTGDATFRNGGPANIPIAGDATNPGPTFAMLQQRQAVLLTPGPSKIGDATTRAVWTAGTSGTFPEGADYPKATINAYDNATGHNVAAAFSAFRAQVGVSLTGLAVSEPFWSLIRVGGVGQNVLIQAFERRVLTYTPDNPPTFRVEFGNIGQQYYEWRYGDATTIAPPATPTATTTTTSTTLIAERTATTTAPSAPCSLPGHANFNSMSANITRNTPIVVTATVVDASGRICGDGTQVVIADTGTASIFDNGAKAANGTAYVVAIVRDGVARTILTYKGPSQDANPVRIGVYAITSITDLKSGIFGVLLVDPLYVPLIF